MEEYDFENLEAIKLVRTNSYASLPSDGGAGNKADLAVTNGKPKTRRCVTAYDDLVPIAWKDVPIGEPDPEPLYLSTSAARLYMGLDDEEEVTVRGEEPVIEPADVSGMHQALRMQRSISVAMLIVSATVSIGGVAGSAPIACSLGALLSVLSLMMLIGNLTDTSPLLVKAAYDQQERLLAEVRRLASDRALPNGDGGTDGETEGHDAPSTGCVAGGPKPNDPDEHDGEETYEDRMSRRAEDIRRRLSALTRTSGDGASASALVIGEASWQTQKAGQMYGVAMSAIDRQFEPNSISWQRFAYGVRTGYARILDNSESVARCMESLDMTAYDGGRRYWGPDGQLDVPVPVPSSEYERTHESLLRLIDANKELLDSLTRLSCDLASMMADEAVDGTEGIAEYLQSLVDDLPEYRSEAQADGEAFPV